MKNTKEYLFLGLLTVAAIGALIFNPKFKKAFDESYHKKFVEIYREKFIKNCQGPEPTHQRMAVCECIASEALRQLTVKELRDYPYATMYMKKNITPGCVEKYKLPPLEAIVAKTTAPPKSS